MAPRRRAVPRRELERLVPGREQAIRAIATAELRSTCLYPFVVVAQRTPAQPRRSVRCVAVADGEYELGKQLGSFRSDLLDGDVLALDPGEDGPGKREALCGLAAPERLRNRERDGLGEDGQPLELALQPLDLLLLPRQPHELVGAEPVVRVVRPEWEDRLDREIRPLRELPGDEALHEGRVGVDLVRVHAHVQPPP